MPSLNRVELIGHVGRDPEMRMLPSGTAITNFSIATSEKWTDKATGEKKERTEWHQVQVFGKQAELVREYVTKGMLVYVSGQLRYSEWEDKTSGEKKQRAEVRVSGFGDQVLFLGGGNGGERKSRQQQGAPPPPRQQPGASASSAADDDVPF